MPHYRLYTLNNDGHIRAGADLEASDDQEALQLARLRLEHCDLSLWRGTAHIALVPKDGLPRFLQLQRPQLAT